MVDGVERGHALRHELVPELFVFDIARMQLGRFAPSQLGYLRMRIGESLQRGIGINDRELLLGVFVGGSGRRCLFRRGEHSFLNRQRRPLLREFGRQRVIVRQLVDQSVQASQFDNGRTLVSGIVSKMFVAVDDHPELRPPIADVVVRQDAMPEEPKDAIERVADDRAAEMSDVHRLSDVWRREVHDVRARCRSQRHAESIVARQLRGLVGQSIRSHGEVDEARPGDLGRLAQIRHIQLGDQRGGKVTRWLLAQLGERHNAIGLEVSKLAVLRWLEHLGKRVGRIGERDEGCS